MEDSKYCIKTSFIKKKCSPRKVQRSADVASKQKAKKLLERYLSEPSRLFTIYSSYL